MATTLSSAQATRERIQTLLADYFEQGIVRAAAYGAPFERLWRVAGQSVPGGKLLRPMLLLATFDALNSDALNSDGLDSDGLNSDGLNSDLANAGSRGGVASRDVAERLALAVELLHYAFLLHDDVIDGDLLRRGQPNLIGAVLDEHERGADEDAAAASRPTHWAQTCGILMGDLLLAAAHQIVARADVPAPQRETLLDLLEEAVVDSVAGEHADVGLSDAAIPPALATILAMTTRKTATYTFELPLRMAAVLAGATTSRERRLGEIGRHLGLAFQLRDDLDSAFGDPAQHGKDRFSDLREGKETAIIAAARSTTQWPRINDLRAPATRSQTDAAVLSEALIDCGAEARVADLAEQELRSAAAVIGGDDTNAEAEEALGPAVRAVLLDLVEQVRGSHP